MRHLLIAAALLLAPPALAQEWTQAPAGVLSPEIEATAREVGKALRCVVCQNQSIEESAAPLAEDMRRLVRERLASGDSKDEVMTYMTERYGNFVRLQPPLNPETLLLWFSPLIFLAIGIWGWFAYLAPSRKRELAPAPLTADEAAELDRRFSKGGA